MNADRAQYVRSSGGLITNVVMTLYEFVHSLLSTVRTHVSYGITQFSLSHDRGDVPALTPLKLVLNVSTLYG